MLLVAGLDSGPGGTATALSGGVPGDVAALNDLAEDGVPAVEVGGGHGGYEELRPVGPGTRVRHGQQVGPVEGELRVELVGELAAGTAGTGTERVTALDHKVRDDPVEDRPVVKLGVGRLPGPWIGPFPCSLRQVDEVPHRLGRVVGEQPDGDRPAVCPQLCGNGVRRERNHRTAGA